MATDIETTVAALRAQHQPVRVPEYVGFPTPTARGNEGRPLAAVAVAAPGAAAAPVPAWRAGPQASSQPLPLDKRYVKSIDAHGGRIIVKLQPGERAANYAQAHFADIAANGVDGFPVRLMQSHMVPNPDRAKDPKALKMKALGPVIIASSDPADGARIFAPAAAQDRNGSFKALADKVTAARAQSAKGAPAVLAAPAVDAPAKVG